MKKIKAAIQSFFYKPLPKESLGFFRMAIAFFALVQVAVLWPDWDWFYSPTGLLPWEISDALSVSNTPAISHVAKLLAPLGISAYATVYIVTAIYVLSLVGLLFGFYTRLMAFLAWLMHMLLHTTGHITAYGVETFLHIALFYCLAFPVGCCWSYDAIKRKQYQQLPGYIVTLCMRVLQLHLCITYLSTGMEKAMGEQWWNGEAIWMALQQDQFHQVNMNWMARVPWLPTLLGWGTLLLEGMYPLGMLWRKTKKAWLIGIIGLHAGIIFLLGLHLFGALMILLNIAAFGEHCFPGWMQKVKRLFSNLLCYWK